MPDVVDELIGAFLTEMDEAVPGFLQGFYLVGSVALDDFHQESSDIDFIAVTVSAPSQNTLRRVGRIHERLRRRTRHPTLDGTYVSWADLASDTDMVRPFGISHEGRFRPAPAGTTESPVTWHSLNQVGLTVRGPTPDRLHLPLDGPQLRHHLRENLADYWARWLRRSASLTTPRGWFAATPWATEWIVTGVSRIHCTLATGRIISKLEATRYAASTFDRRWHRVIREAERIRDNGGAGANLSGYLRAALFEFRSPTKPHYRSRLSRRQDALAFGWMVIADINRHP